MNILKVYSTKQWITFFQRLHPVSPLVLCTKYVDTCTYIDVHIVTAEVQLISKHHKVFGISTVHVYLVGPNEGPTNVNWHSIAAKNITSTF